MSCAYHTKWCDKCHCGGANHNNQGDWYPTVPLSKHHLVWYAHFIFYNVYLAMLFVNIVAS